MGISVKEDTKFPNASIALAQFFTNPRSMVEFAKQVAVYPSSPAAFDDPFFSSTTPAAIEDSARPLAKDIIAKYADIVPTIPKKADVNAIVLDGGRVGAVQRRRRPAGADRRRRRGQQAASSSDRHVRAVRPASRSPGRGRADPSPRTNDPAPR